MAKTGRTVADLAISVQGRVLPGSTGGSEPVSDVTHDSREAGPGVMFVAIRGANADGHDFIESAVALGSTAVCVDSPVETTADQIVVTDTRSALGPLASAVHDDPSASLDVVGVTGTNGKTTVTHFLVSIAESAGLTTGLIGTIESRVAGRVIESLRTTPEASDLQRLLAEMRDEGVDLVAAEVSSHALELGRVAATSFRVAAFTNLSHDHLDFHGDMDSYFDAKRRLFTEHPVGTAVVNVDDPAGRRIASDFPGTLLTVGGEADIRFELLRPSDARSVFRLATPWGEAELEAPVVGSFNVSNAVMAAACALADEVDFEDVVAGLEALRGVPGRFEIVSGDDPIRVIVDYAHTPEGIEAALVAARSMHPRRVVALIGAGGDRDPHKRPLMGAAVAAADLAVITSDNPRSESPEAIIAAVRQGVPDGAELLVEVDRRSAIDIALDSAGDGDVVLLLGRGHEPYQETGGQRVPFDDRQVAREALARRRSAGSGGRSGSMAP